MPLSLSGDGTLSGVDIAASGLGKIVSFHYVNSSASQSVTSASFIDVTGLSISITPSVASNLVFLMVNIPTAFGATSGSLGAELQFVRDSTAISTLASESGYRIANMNPSTNPRWNTIMSMMYVDSPATTSAVTYKVQCRVPYTANSHSAGLNSSGSKSTFVLCEVAA